MKTRNELLQDFENAQNNLNAIETLDCTGKMPEVRYNRLLAAAIKQSESALDSLFEGRG